MYGRATVAVATTLLMTACAGSSALEFGRADGDTIRQMTGEFVTAFNNHDVDAIAKLYAGDATFMPPNSSTVRGPESISGYFRTLFSSGEAVIEMEAAEVGGHGALAFASGTYVLNTTTPVVDDEKGEREEDKGADEDAGEADPSVERSHDRGKYLVVLRKLAGQWRYQYTIWNSDLPVPAASQSEPAK